MAVMSAQLDSETAPMAELCNNLIHNSYATNVDNQQISIGILSPEATVHLMFDCPISRKGDNQC